MNEVLIAISRGDTGLRALERPRKFLSHSMAQGSCWRGSGPLSSHPEQLVLGPGPTPAAVRASLCRRFGVQAAKCGWSSIILQHHRRSGERRDPSMGTCPLGEGSGGWGWGGGKVKMDGTTPIAQPNTVLRQGLIHPTPGPGLLPTRSPSSVCHQATT